jgi:hypothetical protein
MDTTPSSGASETILKTDVLGRIKTPRARREELLEQFERSALSGQKFAELVGVKYQTFATWAQKRRRQSGAYGGVKASTKAAEQVRWLEAVVQEAQSSLRGAGGNPGPYGDRNIYTDYPQIVLQSHYH